MLPMTQDQDTLTEDWVIEQLSKLGLSAIQIIDLIDNQVDYHEAEKLIKAGCPIDLVVEILT